MLARIDHVVYATPDLAAGIEEFEKRTGVCAAPGGQHPDWGTRNALVALGPASYLEIIGPDPDQPRPERPRPFGIDHLTAPRIVTWAANGADLETLVRDAAERGIRLGKVRRGKRERPDGVLLTWSYTELFTVVADGVVPFFIDWGQTEHPARGAPHGVRLIAFRAEHPQPEPVQKMLRDLGLDLIVTRGGSPRLYATIETAEGRIELH